MARDAQDGFPRNVAQADALEGMVAPNQVLNITLPEQVLMAKIMGRRVCRTCGANYNVASIQQGDLDMPPMLPKVHDTCDRCGSKNSLEQRADDKEDVVRERLKVYHAETKPLIEYYTARGILQTFAVKKGVRDTDQLLRELNEFHAALAAAKSR